MSPFQALYGREPQSLVAAPPATSTPPAVADLIRQRGALLVELCKNLERAQQRMRDTANRSRQDVKFKVGDMVWLKLQQYRQHSVARPQSAKLSHRYYGPFKVIKRIGPVAYRLQLPDGCRIHNVFHVNLLKAFVQGESDSTSMPLPEEFMQSCSVLHPMEAFDRRLILQEGVPVDRIRIRWADENASETWEPVESISRRFPELLLEDKELSKEGN